MIIVIFITVADWVIAVIVVVILVVAASVGGIIGYLVWRFCCHHRESQLFYAVCMKGSYFPYSFCAAVLLWMYSSTNYNVGELLNYAQIAIVKLLKQYQGVVTSTALLKSLCIGYVVPT